MANDKTLLYICGCGRSGSTVLGFCLGNAAETLDLGEVIDYAPRGGRPNGFPEGTETFAYWQKVGARLAADANWIGLERFLSLQRRFDTHLSFFPVLLFGRFLGPFGLNEYRKALRRFYDAIFAESQHKFYVDSSKYPSRLLHLSHVYGPERLCGVHLIRDPAGVVASFAKNVQRNKGFLLAAWYYFVVNLFASILFRAKGGMRSARVRYEHLASAPEEVLEMLGARWDLDVSEVRERIAAGGPLVRGFLMNGNRMRRDDHIVFKKRVPACGDEAINRSVAVRVLRRMFLLPAGQVS